MNKDLPLVPCKKGLLMRRQLWIAWLTLLLLSSGTLLAGQPLPQNSYFVPNLGQWDGDFAFRFSQGTTTYFLTETGMSLDLREAVPRSGDYVDEKMDMAGHVPTRQKQGVRGHVLQLSYINANPQPEIIGEDLLSHYSNYFLSRDSCKWRGHVPNYQKVIVKEVWPGIDVEYRASEQGIETVYHVKPYADASQIQLNYEGQDGAITIDANGKLHLQTSLGPMIEETPFAFQIQNHLQSQVPVQFYLLGDHSYGFVLGNYDPSQEVVIDPIIYCSYFPTNLDDFTDDYQGNKLICGHTFATNFPTTPGAYQETDTIPTSNGTISRLSPDGTSLLFSTYFPGGGELARIRSDRQGRLFYFANAMHWYWPLTADAYDTTVGNSVDEAGFAELSSDGSQLLYSTFLGGSGREYVRGMELDSSGLVYLCGETESQDLPVTPNAWYPTMQPYISPFLALYNPDIHSFLEVTYWTGIAGRVEPVMIKTISPPNCLWLYAKCYNPGMPTSPDAFQTGFPGGVAYSHANYLVKLNLQNHEILYATYFYGYCDTLVIDITHVVPTDSGRLWIGGNQSYHGIPIPAGGYDTIPAQGGSDQLKAFILEMQMPATIMHATYLGRDGDNQLSNILCEPGGSIILTGYTASRNFPTTPDAYDSIFHYNPQAPENGDLFLCRLSPNLDRLLYGTFIGTYGNEFVRSGGQGTRYEGPDQIWLCGWTNSPNFPLTSDAFWTNSQPTFILRFALPPYQDAVSPHISFLPDNVSLTCYPNPFNPTTTISFTLPHEARVDLNVYDVTGRIVRRLAGGHIGPPLQAGEHRIEFDGSDLPSGIYFAWLDAGEVSQTRKMVLLK
jgi:hypothetical protein